MEQQDVTHARGHPNLYSLGFHGGGGDSKDLTNEHYSHSRWGNWGARKAERPQAV